jgi:hypothetical protein
MKRRQPQFETREDMEREVDRYTALQVLKDSFKLAVIFVSCLLAIGWIAKHGAEIDTYCNYFLRP